MKTIQMMYEHLHWANGRIFETIKRMEKQNQEVIRLFSHILFAEQVWITRLQGLDSSQLPIWSEEADLETCEKLMMQNQKAFATFLTDLGGADLDQGISYTNSKGTVFRSSVRDILTHVALHGQYHRGQINARFRAAGIEPVNVDFITFVR